MAVKVQGTTVITDSRQIRSNEITDEAGTGPTDFPNGLEGASLFFTATVTGFDGASDWTGSDPTVATITVNGIKATDRPIVSLDISGETQEDGIFLQRVWNLVYRVEASADNQIKLYAVGEPISNFNLIIKVVR